MKNRLILLGLTVLTAGILLLSPAVLAQGGISDVQSLQTTSLALEEGSSLEDGTYQVQVDLWNASADKASMGNAALNHNAVLTVKNAKGTLKVEFKGMTFAGLTGYLSQLDLMTDIEYNEFSYPEKYSTVPATVISTYDYVDEYNSEDSTDDRCRGKKYPRELEIPVELGQEFTWVHVYVPVMGSFDAGDQEARIKVDYSTIKKAEEEVKQTLTLNKTSFALTVGKTAAIEATAAPAGTITYKSANKKIATVSKQGIIKAVKKGTVKIAVTCNGVKKIVTVEVKQALTLKKTSFVLTVGKTAAIKATATPADTVTYKSANKKIATVSKKGVIKAVKKGTVKIAATCNGVKKIVTVKVK